MEVAIEEIITYAILLLIAVFILLFYTRHKKRKSTTAENKISQAKEDGLYEPVSLYPVVDSSRCIQSGACIKACPEHDILGIMNGKATIINAAQCIGHGACFLACPTEAITLKIGTEKRGVELPHIQPNFETNVPGIFIAGELGGMGLIRNAVKQGREAVENIAKTISKKHDGQYDIIVVGAGPAGISATLTAKKEHLNVLTLEQDTLGGTVYNYPRSKIIMTHPMELPLYGRVKLTSTSKDELLELWNKVLTKNDITIREKSKVASIQKNEDIFEVKLHNGDTFTSHSVLLALGRRGTPRKLNIPGEQTQKVAYRLLDEEQIEDKKVAIIGGGDSAIEAALLLANKNKVSLSYRGEKFVKLKKRNAELIENAAKAGLIEVLFNTEAQSIEPDQIVMKQTKTNELIYLDNDLVYIFAGGELPAEFLKKAGIQMNTKFGEVIMKHQRN